MGVTLPASSFTEGTRCCPREKVKSNMLPPQLLEGAGRPESDPHRWCASSISCLVLKGFGVVTGYEGAPDPREPSLASSCQQGGLRGRGSFNPIKGVARPLPAPPQSSPFLPSPSPARVWHTLGLSPAKWPDPFTKPGHRPWGLPCTGVLPRHRPQGPWRQHRSRSVSTEVRAWIPDQQAWGEGREAKCGYRNNPGPRIPRRGSEAQFCHLTQGGPSAEPAHLPWPSFLTSRSPGGEGREGEEASQAVGRPARAERALPPPSPSKLHQGRLGNRAHKGPRTPAPCASFVPASESKLD